MDGGLLVTGKPVALLEAIAERALSHQAQIVITPGAHSELSEVLADRVHSATWNRRSALSARSVVLHTVNLFRSLEEAVIVYAPARDTAPLHEISVVRIEERVDAEVKGYLFMIREVLACFIKQGHGKLLFAVRDSEEESRSPIEAAASGSFVSMAEAIFSHYQNEPISIRGLYTTSKDHDQVAHVALDLLSAEPNSRLDGRWQHYPSRGGLLARLRRR